MTLFFEEVFFDRDADCVIDRKVVFLNLESLVFRYVNRYVRKRKQTSFFARQSDNFIFLSRQLAKPMLYYEHCRMWNTDKQSAFRVRELPGARSPPKSFPTAGQRLLVRGQCRKTALKVFCQIIIPSPAMSSNDLTSDSGSGRESRNPFISSPTMCSASAHCLRCQQ